MTFHLQTTKYLVLAAALAATSAPTPADAADLGKAGGDCCADLEARVADLEASAARTGNKKVELKISGRVNAGVLWWSDGFGAKDLRDPAVFDSNTNVYVVNNSMNRTKVDIEGTGKIREGWSAGFSMSLRPWGSNLDKVSQIDHNPKPGDIGVENTYVFIEAEAIGKLQLGLQDGAANEAWGQDLGGSSSWLTSVNSGDWNASFHLRDATGGLTDMTWDSVLSDFGDAQEPRLMFSSREVAGFHVAASVGGQRSYAAALFYAQSYGKVSVAAAVAYDVSTGSDALDSQAAGYGLVDMDHDKLAKFAGSLSVYESGSGLYGSLAWSHVASDMAGRSGASNAYGKLGWRKNVLGWGETNVYAEADRTTAAYADDTSAHMVGLGVTQDIDAAAAVIYLGYRHTALDNSIAGASLVPTAAQTAGGLAPTPAGLVPAQQFDAVLAGMVLQF